MGGPFVGARAQRESKRYAAINYIYQLKFATLNLSDVMEKADPPISTDYTD
jgi:hypothetical protein